MLLVEGLDLQRRARELAPGHLDSYLMHFFGLQTTHGDVREVRAFMAQDVVAVRFASFNEAFTAHTRLAPM